MRPHIPAKKRPARHRRKQRHLRHHRLAGQERAEPQRQGRPVGHLVPRLLHGGGHDRRPPGAEGRLAAGADHRLVHRRRLAPQRRLLPAARLQLPGQLRPARGPSRPRSSTPTFDHGTPDGYEFFLRLGPLANADARYFKGDVAFWNEVMRHGTYDEFWKARNLRPHLKNIKPGRADRRRLVRRREPVRRPGDLPARSRRTAPATTNMLVMGPWSHGGWSRRRRRRRSGTSRFNAKTGRVLPRADRASRSSSTT